MFTRVEDAGAIIVWEILLEFTPVGFCGWVWQGSRDWWWLCPFWAMAFLLWGGSGGSGGRAD